MTHLSRRPRRGAPWPRPRLRAAAAAGGIFAVLALGATAAEEGRSAELAAPLPPNHTAPAAAAESTPAAPSHTWPAAAARTTPAPGAPSAAPSDRWRELAELVEIRRDRYGVPHIRAETLEAAGFALAWVQLEDYGDRIILGLIRARGESSLILGEDRGSVPADVRARRDREQAMRNFHRLPAGVRDVYAGFAEGVNRYVALHPDEVPEAVGVRFTGHDVLARDVVSPSWAAGNRFVSALEAREEAQRDAEADARGAAFASAYRGPDPEPAPPPGWEEGSNTWAFAPSRTASGHAILMRNPHLSWTSGYYEAQVVVPGVLHFHGDFRIGGPFGIIGGFNDRLGWSTTNNSTNLTEIYALERDPVRRNHYLFDGASIPLEPRITAVAVRGEEGVRIETDESWESPLGPVVHRTDERIYVLRSAGADEYRLGEQFFRMMTARDLEEWKEAMRLRARTSSNFTYADADGNIFYVWNARMPHRPHPPGGDTIAIEARGSADVWTELVPFDSLPQLLNPPGGYLRNENDPFHHTNLNAILPAERFPDHYPEPRVRLRSQRSLELIHVDAGASPAPLTLEDVVELKHDARMNLADRVLDDLIAEVRRVTAGQDGDPSAAERMRAADLLEAWDRTANADARGAVLFAEWWDRYMRSGERASSSPESAGFSSTAESLFRVPWSMEEPMTSPRGLADPARAVAALDDAMAAVAAQSGSWDVAWGEVHRARRGDLDLPASGCDGILGCFRVLWFTDQSDGTRTIRGGDGWVFAVEFGETPRAYTVLAYGQSDREDSPHHTDQLQMFVEGRMKPVAFTEPDVEASTVRRYRPGLEPRMGAGGR